MSLIHISEHKIRLRSSSAGIINKKKPKGKKEDLKAKIRKLANFWEEINTDKIIFFGMIIDLDSQVSINKSTVFP